MFDVDEFIVQCQDANAEAEPRRAIREVLDRVLSEPGAVADVLKPTEAGLVPLLRSDDLTILHVVWAPKMKLFPHDHKMWAAIGVYTGQEDNAFYRRVRAGEPALTESGGKQLSPGDTVLLGDDTIHSVTNPRNEMTGTIHVYGGDFFAPGRSQWEFDLTEERPWDIDDARRQFAEANAAWRASTQ